MQEEVWKDVVGYEGLYRVSNYGNVISIPRLSKKRNRIYAGQKLNCTKFLTGYLNVGLSKDSITTKYNVHRLVAEAFIPNPENKATVNHKDGNKLNNNINNLEWNTYTENNRHAFANNLIKRYCGKDNKASKPVSQYTRQNIKIKDFDCIKEAARQTNTNGSSIGACCNNKRKSAGGYFWKFNKEAEQKGKENNCENNNGI